MRPVIISDRHAQWMRTLEEEEENATRVTHIEGWHGDTAYFAMQYALWCATALGRRVMVMVPELSYVASVWWRMLHMECVYRDIAHPSANCMDLNETADDIYDMSRKLSSNLIVFVGILTTRRPDPNCFDILIVDSVTDGMRAVPKEWDAIPKIIVLWEDSARQSSNRRPMRQTVYEPHDVITHCGQDSKLFLTSLYDALDCKNYAIHAIHQLLGAAAGVGLCVMCGSDYTVATARIIKPCMHIVCFPCACRAQDSSECKMCDSGHACVAVTSLAKTMRVAKEAVAVREAALFLQDAAAGHVLLVVADTHLSPAQRDILHMIYADRDKPVVNVCAQQPDRRCILRLVWSHTLMAVDDGAVLKSIGPQLQHVTHVLSVGLGVLGASMMHSLPFNPQHTIEYMQQ